MSMAAMAGTVETVPTVNDLSTLMTKMEVHLATRGSKTYNAHYNGKMSYTLHGDKWDEYVSKAFPDLKDQTTSENVFKTVIDLYAENLVPLPKELKGFSNCIRPLLCRGEVPVLVDNRGEAHFPEHFEMISDGVTTITALFTRSLANEMDNIIFAYSDGRTRLFSKPIPEDMSPADHTNLDGFRWVEETTGNTLFRFALDDKGFGPSLAALQDRLNHSIIDQTVVEEMYARPFWYLLNADIPPENPYLPKTVSVQGTPTMKETRTARGSGGRIFTTSAAGPFGQLDPPTIGDMIGYHDSIIDKVPLSFGIPIHYLKPGSGTPPTGVALMVLSKRFNNKVSRMRDDIEEELIRLADLLGVEKTKEVKTAKPKAADNQLEGLEQEAGVQMEYDLWSQDDDLLQEAIDQHGINLSTMGYPLEYIAEVVTPGVDLDDYEEPGGLPADGQLDMTALGQRGTPATPGQVQSYSQNPGQIARS